MNPSEIAIQADIIRDECVSILEREGYHKDAEKLRNTNITLNNRMRVAAGRAYTNSPFEIKLSIPIFSRPENEHHFFQTVTHELAHIVAGARAGHGCQWKAVHRLFGGNAERCHNLTVQRNSAQKRVSVFCVCGKEVELGPKQYKSYLRGAAFKHLKINGGCGDIFKAPNHGQSWASMA